MGTPITVDWKTVAPGVPSLFHFAVVKIVVPWFNEFGPETLETAYTDIELGNTATLNEDSPGDSKANMAKEKLLSIPAHLRHSVFKAVMGMRHAISDWELYLKSRLFLDSEKIECPIFWRYDGLIDDAKTAQHLVKDVNIDIKKRFALACLFCLDKSVLSLWAEMDKFDKAQLSETDNRRLTNFWVRWIREGSRIPWTKAICKNIWRKRRGFTPPNLSSFFPLLPPNKRAPIMLLMFWARTADKQLCLRIFTAKEKRYFLEKCYLHILVMYLQWPLQDHFLEIIEKMFPFMGEFEFCEILLMIWIYWEPEQKKDFDYFNLFVKVWNASPQHLKEIAVKDDRLKRGLNSMFNKLSQKRKDFISNKNQNKRLKTN